MSAARTFCFYEEIEYLITHGLIKGGSLENAVVIRDDAVLTTEPLRYPDDAAVMAYIGRSGWNTLRIGGAIPDDELIEAVDSSYDAVLSKLPKKDRPTRS